MAARSIRKYYNRFLGRSAPILTRLVALNILVFLVAGIAGLCHTWFGFPDEWAHTWLALSSSPFQVLLHPWTLLTYMFTHYGVIHILFNLLWLWWFGQILLLTLSEARLLWVYLLSGLSGGIVYLLAYNLIPAFQHTPALLNGASASVLGIMTVAAFRSPDYELRLFLLGAVRLKWVALVCIVLAFLGLGGGNAGGEAAHIGGVAFGCVYGLSLRKGKDFLAKARWRRHATQEANYLHSTRRFQQATSNYRRDVERLDEILDKIRTSGFESLSAKEKNELKALSERLNKKERK